MILFYYSLPEDIFPLLFQREKESGKGVGIIEVWDKRGRKGRGGREKH